MNLILKGDIGEGGLTYSEMSHHQMWKVVYDCVFFQVLIISPKQIDEATKR